MAEFMIRDTTAKDLADLARDINGTTDTIKGVDIVKDIREGLNHYLDTTLITDWSNWFQKTDRYKTTPYIDTRNGEKFDHFFARCASQNFPEEKFPFDKIDTNKGTTFVAFLDGTDVKEISPIPDTSNAEDLSYFCNECVLLQNAPAIDTSNCKFFEFMYYKCYEMVNGGSINMESIDTNNASLSAQYMYAACTKLTDLTIHFNEETPTLASNLMRMFYQTTELVNLTITGKIKVDKDQAYGLSVAYCSKLSVDSLISVLEALEDNSEESTTYTVAIGGANLTKLKNHIRPETITPENPNGLTYNEDPEHILRKVQTKNIAVS